MKFNERCLIITDVETTGLNPRSQDIIEIGAIKVDRNLQELARFETKIQVQNPLTMDLKALEINGYNSEEWLSAPNLPTAMLAFSDFSAEGVLCSWNITFEYTFLDEAFIRTRTLNRMDYHRLDLPSIAMLLFPHAESLGCDNIAEKLGIEKEPTPHRAIRGAQQDLLILGALSQLLPIRG